MLTKSFHFDSVLTEHADYVNAKESALAMIRLSLTDNYLMFRVHSVVIQKTHLSFIHSSGCVSPVGVVLKIRTIRANVPHLHSFKVHHMSILYQWIVGTCVLINVDK